MFYVFRSSWGALDGPEQAAQGEGRVHDELFDLYPEGLVKELWGCEPLRVRPPELPFSVPRNTKPLDNWVTGDSLDLYSERLLSILRAAGIRYEAFPAVLVDRRTREPLGYRYAVFHLLECAQVLDPAESVVGGREQYLVADPSFRPGGAAMVRDPLSRLVFVDEEMKRLLEGEGVSGCQFTPLERYGRPSEAELLARERLARGEVAEEEVEESFREAMLEELHPAMDALGIDERTPPREVVRLIAEAASAQRDPSQDGQLTDDRLWHFGYSLGILWGEQFVRRYGWRWARLRVPEQHQPVFAVVSPDASFFLDPMGLIGDTVAGRRIPSDALSLFEMVGEGQLQRGGVPESYTRLG